MKRRAYIETYGCQMNVYDSSMVVSALAAAGYELTDGPEDADVVIVNTCTVRERAEQRVLGRLRHLRGLAPPHALVGAIGCVAQQMGEELFEAVRGLSFVLGTDAYGSLPGILDRASSGRAAIDVTINPAVDYAERPAATTARLCDFVSVMRGCDNFCSYCIVPYVRGRERSLPARAVVREVEHMAGLGTRDVTLLGQNVNSYSDGSIDFAGLLALVDAVDGIERIRFATSHPKDLSPSLIEAVAGLGSVCEHVHLPVQSGSDRVLALMNRGYTRAHYMELVASLRRAVPDVAITTDIIAGFPGETREDFERTLELMRSVRFDSAFMFRYSVRRGTAAARLTDDVAEEEKIERLEEVIALQRSITSKINEGLVGSTVQVLVEGPSQRDPRKLFGRTRAGKAVVLALAPGAVPHRGAGAGSMLEAVVTEASAWTLHATPVAGEKPLAGPPGGC